MINTTQRLLIDEIKKEIQDETKKICTQENYTSKEDFQRITISCLVFNEKYCSLMFRFQNTISTNTRHCILDMLMAIQKEVQE